jgi:hypothetical protein
LVVQPPAPSEWKPNAHVSHAAPEKPVSQVQRVRPPRTAQAPCPEQVAGAQTSSTTHASPSRCVPGSQPQAIVTPSLVHTDRSGLMHGLGRQGSRVQPPAPSA